MGFQLPEVVLKKAKKAKKAFPVYVPTRPYFVQSDKVTYLWKSLNPLHCNLVSFKFIAQANYF